MKKIISLLLSVVFLFTMFIPCFAVDNIALEDSAELVTGYQYSITAESENWFDYTVREKVEMLKISDEKLATMTDAELIHAIADYPYLVDIYLYGDSVEEGIAVARTYFSALNELLSRETGADSMATYGIQLANSRYLMYQRVSIEEDDSDLFVAGALMDILDTFDVRANEEDNAVTLTASARYIYTVDGYPVLAYMPEENHSAEAHSEVDNEMVEVYGVTLVSSGSCLYNCHSYAWFSQSTSNPYWIDNPTPYMAGDSYTRRYIGGMGTPANTTSIRFSDIVFYGDYENPESLGTWHSALYISDSTSGAPLGVQMCRSKWGQLGVFEHQLGNVPSGYDIYNISVWGLV